MADILDNINKELDSQIKNPYIIGLLNVVMVLYAGLVAPELPQIVKVIFNHTVGKIMFIAMIAFVANKNPSISIMLAVVFIVTMNMIQTEKFAQHIIEGGGELDDEEEEENNNILGGAGCYHGEKKNEKKNEDEDENL